MPLPSPPASAKAAWRRMPIPLHFIDGNHHDYSVTRGLSAAAEVLPGLVYQPRGSVADLDGRRLAFLGGAESTVDLEWRQRGRDYWPDHEAIRAEDVARLLTNTNGRRVDFLVTHIAPASVMARHTSTHSVSAGLVEQAWNELGRPPLVCGHLHTHYQGEGVEVLPYLGSILR